MDEISHDFHDLGDLQDLHKMSCTQRICVTSQVSTKPIGNINQLVHGLFKEMYNGVAE